MSLVLALLLLLFGTFLPRPEPYACPQYVTDQGKAPCHAPVRLFP